MCDIKVFAPARQPPLGLWLRLAAVVGKVNWRLRVALESDRDCSPASDVVDPVSAIRSEDERREPTDRDTASPLQRGVYLTSAVTHRARQLEPAHSAWWVPAGPGRSTDRQWPVAAPFLRCSIGRQGVFFKGAHFTYPIPVGREDCVGVAAGRGYESPSISEGCLSARVLLGGWTGNGGR